MQSSSKLSKTFFLMTLLLSLTVNMAANAAYGLNLTRGVTPVSQEQYELHMTILYICAVIGLLVFGVLIYTIIFHRKSRGQKPANFHESTTVEIIWTVIPFFILISMAIPATLALKKFEDTSESDLTIKVTGYQWKWRYEYLHEGISFFSNLASTEEQINNQSPKGENYLLEVDNELIVPINKKIKFVTTANDVIHSWWVPALGIKKDAIPGFIGKAWAIIEKPGIYRGQCAELCGLKHGFMPIVVKAVTEEEYLSWLDKVKAEQKEAKQAYGKEWTMQELMQHGEEVYNTVCAVCHQKNGQGLPPAFPSLINSPIISGDIKDHIDIVLHGKQGTAMQAFKDQLNDVDIAAVITYERNAWANNKGDMVQPKEIKEQR